MGFGRERNSWLRMRGREKDELEWVEDEGRCQKWNVRKGMRQAGTAGREKYRGDGVVVCILKLQVELCPPTRLVRDPPYSLESL